MVVPSFIRIERGSDRGHVFNFNNVPFSALISGNINVSLSAAPKLAIVPASRYNCDVKQLNLNVS